MSKKLIITLITMLLNFIVSVCRTEHYNETGSHLQQITSSLNPYVHPRPPAAASLSNILRRHENYILLRVDHRYNTPFNLLKVVDHEGPRTLQPCL